MKEELKNRVRYRNKLEQQLSLFQRGIISLGTCADRITALNKIINPEHSTSKEEPNKRKRIILLKELRLYVHLFLCPYKPHAGET